MEDYERSSSSVTNEEDMDVRKGPWTEEEDAILVNYVSVHGEGRWNNIARFSGLKRTGKSCRLRWLNYLRPDVRRGNITPQEQLLILQLHYQYGNRWSKIAQFLPGRTDNEIKNYWRTRVQKQAKQLKCDVNSKLFKDTMRYVWMPRLLERIQAQSSPATSQPENAMNIEPIQPVYHNEPGSDGAGPAQRMHEFSSTSSDSPDTLVSTVFGLAGHNHPDGSVNGLGFELDDSVFGGFNDWVCGGDTTEGFWNDEDSFLYIQEQEQEQLLQ